MSMAHETSHRGHDRRVKAPGNRAAILWVKFCSNDDSRAVGGAITGVLQPLQNILRHVIVDISDNIVYIVVSCTCRTPIHRFFDII